MKELLVAAVVIVIGYAGAMLAGRKDVGVQSKNARYRVLKIITVDNRPSRELPIKLLWPSIYDTRDVIFTMTESGRGEYVPIVSVEARNLTEEEVRELKQ